MAVVRMPGVADANGWTTRAPSVSEEIQDALLSPFQRILLLTDGTITYILQAYCDEPVVMAKLAQASRSADSEVPELGLGPGETLIERRILLCGAETGRTFLHARSLVASDRLPPDIRDSLISGHRPIGDLIHGNRMETFREILVVGREPAGHVGRYFDLDTDAPMFFRTYRIFSSGQPIALIREQFPASAL